MAPNITPWSVSARLVMPCAAAASISGSTRARPSSSEYSVWQCRWVYSGEAIDLMLPEARGMVAALVNDDGRPDGGGKLGHDTYKTRMLDAALCIVPCSLQ